MVKRSFQRQYIKDISRRHVLKTAMGGTALGLSSNLVPSALAAPEPFSKSKDRPLNRQEPELLLSENLQTRPKDPLWGIAMSYGEHRLDLIDLDNSQILHSFEGFEAAHAVIPIEHLNRFVIHGFRRAPETDARIGAILVLDVDPITKKWSVALDRTLKGGQLLHWQPRPDLSEIVFNTIGDGGLHVMDTKTLSISSYVGGGKHSNMAMMDDLLIATDKMAGPSQLLITDRKTNRVLSRTNVGEWGHGVTVNFKRGEAYVWAKDGLHRISLAQKTMGKHLDLIPSLTAGERSWFCWTPQGGQFSHDVAWGWDGERGDVYQPYLSAVDMENARIEKISTGDKDIRPSFLQVSPDSKLGLASLRGRQDIGIFNLENNSFQGTVDVGPARKSFFERDMAFCKNRQFALVTNTEDKSISLIDLITRDEVRRIYLPRQPVWFKSLSA